MIESAKQRLIEAEAARDKASEDVENASPEGIRERL